MELWGELKAGVRWWLWEHEKDTDEGQPWGPVLRDTRRASAGSAPALSRQCYLLAWDPWSSGWANLPRKTRGPLGKKRKTRGRSFQLRRGGLSPEKYMWGLVYRDWSFPNISSGAGTLLFAEEIWRPHSVRQISTECVWIKVGGGDPRATLISLSLPVRLHPGGSLGSKKISLTFPDSDLKMSPGSNPNVHQQLNIWHIHTMEYYAAVTKEPSTAQAMP